MNWREKEKNQRENLRRWQEESNIFANMELFSSGLELQRINISGDRNNHRHDEIKPNVFYLVGYNKRWYIATAREQHFGWTLDIGLYAVQLRNADFLFEITNLTEYNNRPLGMLPTYDEHDED